MNTFSMSEDSIEKNRSDASQSSMELLYIWINMDETGFIHQQGFNFSPNYRFEMKVCEDGKYELSCKVNTDYPNVWNTGNIINLTAIVGENGSGKTALLRHLVNAALKPLDKEELGAFSIKSMVQVFRCEKSIKAFHNLGEGKLSNIGYEHIFQICGVEELVNHQTKIYMTNATASPSSIWKSMLKQSPIFFSTTVNSEQAKAFFRKTTGQNSTREFPDGFRNMQALITSSSKYKDYEKLAAISYYHQLNVGKVRSALFTKGTRIAYVGVANPTTWFTKSIYVGETYRQVRQKPRSYYDQYCEILKSLVDKYTQHSFDGNHKIYHDPISVLRAALMFEVVYLSGYESLKPETYKVLCDNPITYLERYYKDQPFYRRSVIRYYESALKEIEELEDMKLEFGPNTFKGIKDERNIAHAWVIAGGFPSYSRFFEFVDRLMRQETSFVLKYLLIGMPPLSSGEQALMKILTWLRLAPAYHESLGENTVPIQDNILLLLDEVDLYMHPEWQRKFLKYLADELEQEYPNKHIQIIISTHSPLVLSDIPSGNIIYLEKNDQKCTIAQGPKTKESFGANIYSLLKDSFFLKRSLGEFAHSKIMEVIDVLDRLKKNPGDTELRKTCEQHKRLIDIIGEPVIRQKLQLLYEDIFGKDPDADAERTLDSVQQLLKSDNPKYRELLKAMLSEVQPE